MKMYDELPAELADIVRNMTVENLNLLTLHQYVKAKAGFEKLYNLLFDSQPIGKRYHKGLALHNIGFAALQLGDSKSALNYFALAYIEDLLYQVEGEENKADDLPAGRTLRDGYRVEDSLLEALKLIVKNKKKLGIVVQEPEQILAELDQKISFVMTAEVPISKTPRKPGQFKSEWKDRVFVGGSYSNHVAEIHRIGEICKTHGFDPVIAAHFETPEDRVHHHALMLLHECKRAIFEVSDDVGQLMEIERLRDYQVLSLMLCQKDKTRLSAMLRTLFESSNCLFQQYSNIEELDIHVKKFLETKA